MNQIKDPPLDSDFGYEFNYASWIAGTRISLVNVHWNNDYRDVVRFADRATLSAYITSLEVAEYVIDDMIRLRVNEPVRIDLPFNKVYRFNYLRVSNPLGPITGDVQRDYYYFINDVREIAPNTTELIVQLDVFQSFIYDVEFGNCYIERGHIGIANENAFSNYGRDYLTIPEGLDLGSEYQIIARRKADIMSAQQNEITDGSDPGRRPNRFNVMIVSNVDLFADPGTITEPKLESATGTKIQGMPSGANVYFVTGPDALLTLMEYYKDKPWITQGIVAIQAVPQPADFGYLLEAPGGTVHPAGVSLLEIVDYGGNNNGNVMFNNWRESDEVLGNLPEKYRILRKFLTYPYCVVELTTWTGKPLILKPELWNDANGFVAKKASFVPPHQRAVFYPRRYNAKPGAVTDTWPNADGATINGDDGGEFLDFATMVSDFPSFAIVNNMGIAYLAGNANSLAFQQRSADWAQQRALRGNEVSYDQASGAMETARALTDLGSTADYAQTQLGISNMHNQAGINALGGIVGGSTQGALGGAAAGPGGAAIGAGMAAVGSTVGGVFNAMGTNAQGETNARAQSLRAAAAKAGNLMQNQQAGLVRDTNRSLADWAAKGDYENTIAGVNAKTQDAQLLQPSTSGQVGGDAFNMIQGVAQLSMRIKMVDQAAIAAIGDYWLRYGYAVRRFGRVPANLMVMSKFTYWKLLETYIISGPMPEGFKQAIRGIFEKGVTVWSNPSDIGNIDLDANEIVEGITL
jgi:hypothetical protein